MGCVAKTPNNLLRKYQWYIIHNPKMSLFGGDEEETSSTDPILAKTGNFKYFDLTSKDIFLTPSNKAIKIPNIIKGAFSKDGMLINFITEQNNKKKKYAAISTSNYFYGYGETEILKTKKFLPETNNGNYRTATEQALVDLQECLFIDYSIAKKDDKITAYANKLVDDLLLEKCICRFKFSATEQQSTPNEGKGIFKNTSLGLIQGNIFDNQIPNSSEVLECEGTGCTGQVVEGLNQGTGEYYYWSLISTVREESKGDESLQLAKEKELILMANYISLKAENKEDIRFYGYGYEATASKEDFVKFLKKDKILSLTTFEDKFKFVCSSRDYKTIFSKNELWVEIDRTKYNINAPDYVNGGNYEYSFADLVVRENFRNNMYSNSFISFEMIKGWEKEGKAIPLSTFEYSEQSTAKKDFDEIVKKLEKLADAVLFDEVSGNIQISQIPLPSLFIDGEQYKLKLMLRGYLSYNRQTDKKSFKYMLIIYFVPLSVDITPQGLIKPDANDLIKQITTNQAVPTSAFIDVRKYISLDGNDVFDNIANTKTVLDGLEERNFTISDILEDGLGSVDDWVYAISKADYFQIYSLKSSPNYNIGFYQPYFIWGTNGVGVLGMRLGVEADYSEVFFDDIPERLNPVEYLKENVKGNVVPFVIFDLGIEDF